VVSRLAAIGVGGARLHVKLSAIADRFPSVKASKLLSILMSEPLGYEIVRQKGSHRRLKADDRPALTVSFHQGTTVPGGLVRKILVDQVGLDSDEARRLI
jgi:predicted RNA binding protein YcfA (HicA-like mRNA interferase family)